MGSWDLSISKELSLVEDAIQANIASQEDLLTEIADYVIDAGGKRVRPAVTILSFYAVGGEQVESAIQIASALELVHNATLLHDDINDGGTVRRGRPAAYKKYGVHRALVTGDFLFTRAFAIGGKFDPRIVDLTAEACVHLAEGEIRQEADARNLATTEEEYLGIILRKTGWFFASGAKIGAVLGGGNADQVEALGEYGTHLGLAFQIVDDLLDVVGDEATLGKPTGTDVREGNMTLLLQHAFHNGNAAERAELGRIVRKESKTDGEVQRALELIVASGAAEEARARAGEHGVQAKEALGLLEPSPYKLELMRLVDLVLYRDM